MFIAFFSQSYGASGGFGVTSRPACLAEIKEVQSELDTEFKLQLLISFLTEQTELYYLMFALRLKKV